MNSAIALRAPSPLGLRPEPLSRLGHSASVNYRVERFDNIATADFFGPHSWRATEVWHGHELTSGYGDTPEAAIAHLERITAWRRN